MQTTLEIPPNSAGAQSYLGPARIVSLEGRQVRLECPDSFPLARLALAQSYEAQVDDLVLAISQGGQWYVIGLLEGKGLTRISAPGDVMIQAPGGCVEIAARDGVRVSGAKVEIVAGALELTAAHLWERFREASRWVRGALHVRAGRISTEVEGESRLQAAEIVQRADGDVKIDGNMIHLA